MNDEERGIDAIIRAAMQRGEFDNLPGKGEPLDLSAYFSAPEEQRVAQAILKNAGFLPREVALFKEIAALKIELQACIDASRQARLRKAIREQTLRLSVLLERRKERRSPRPR